RAVVAAYLAKLPRVQPQGRFREAQRSTVVAVGRGSSLIFVETIERMQGPYRELGIRGIDQDADFDLRGRDRQNIDAFCGKALEHLGSNSGVASHADADDRDLHDVGRALDVEVADDLARPFEDLERSRQLRRLYRKRHVGMTTVGRKILNDHIDVDA